MKTQARLLILLMCCSFSSTAVAATTSNRGPESMNFKMGTLTTPFSHWKHQKLTKDDCLHCHDRKGDRISGWGRDLAHRVCIPCHDLDDKGPIRCKECHEQRVLSPKK